MTDDLVKRLRDCANGSTWLFKTQQGDFGICDQAADRIEALAAERNQLRTALQAIVSGMKAYLAGEPSNPPATGTKKVDLAALNTGREVMPDAVQSPPARHDIGPGDQAVAGAALPTVDELSNIIRTVDGNHNLGAGELAERILHALAQKGAEP